MAEKKSRRLVHDSNRKSVNKKAIIISSVIGGLLAVVAIVLGVLWGTGVFEKKEEKYTYFKDLHSIKINTVDINNKLKDTEHVFLFIYNNDELDAKEGENDTEFDKNDEEIVSQITKLAQIVAEENEKAKFELYHLYLLDTSITNNEKVYEDSNFGSVTADEDPAITYFYRGNSCSAIPEELENRLPEGANLTDYNISCKGTNKLALIQCLKDCKDFIRDLKK